MVHSVPAPLDPRKWPDEYGEALYKYAFIRTQNSETSKDLVQETFLRAFQKAQGFEHRSTEKTWLIAILKNVLREHARREQRIDDNAPLATEASLEALHELTPADAAEHSEFLAAVEHCLLSLPEESARLFREKEFEQKSTATLAQERNTTPNHIRVLIHRSKKLLQRCLELIWFQRKH